MFIIQYFVRSKSCSENIFIPYRFVKANATLYNASAPSIIYTQYKIIIYIDGITEGTA